MVETVVPQASYVTEKQTAEFFNDGLLQAASAARQLGVVQENPIWHDISIILDQMRNSGIDIANSKSLSRTQVLSMVDVRQKTLNAQVEASRRPHFIH